MDLALDLDGVVIEFVDGANEFFRDVHGLPWIESREWSWFKRHGEHGELAYAEFMKSDHPKVLDRWAAMRPHSSALGCIGMLAGNGHRITFVTHRAANRRAVTRQWLDEHGLGDFEVIHADPHASTDASWNKHEWHEADFWLDDNPEVISGLIGAGYNAYLFTRGWNEATSIEAKRRLNGWGDVLVQVGLDQIRKDQDLGVPEAV